MGGNQRINIGEPQLRMQPVQGDQMQGLTPDQGISSQGMGTGDMSSTPAAGRDVGLGREPISGQHGNIRDENLPTEPIGNQRTTVETVGGPNVYVPGKECSVGSACILAIVYAWYVAGCISLIAPCSYWLVPLMNILLPLLLIACRMKSSVTSWQAWSYLHGRWHIPLSYTMHAVVVIQ